MSGIFHTLRVRMNHRIFNTFLVQEPVASHPEYLAADQSLCAPPSERSEIQGWQ
jgi:hypothetical protein